MISDMKKVSFLQVNILATLTVVFWGASFAGAKVALDVYKRQGGDRPSQTARLTMSRIMLQCLRLESQHNKGGIPTASP